MTVMLKNNKEAAQELRNAFAGKLLTDPDKYHFVDVGVVTVNTFTIWDKETGLSFLVNVKLAK